MDQPQTPDQILEERAEEEGYAKLAADTDTSESRAISRRRRPSWADEYTKFVPNS